MSPGAIDLLAAKLLLVIAGASAYDPPVQSPAIAFLPTATLEQRVCGRPCPVYAVFDPREGILLDERLDLSNDVYARSILLHELVHIVKWKKAGHAARDCPEWMTWESEAYRVQLGWLSKLPPDWRDSSLPRPNRSLLRCDGDGSLAATSRSAAAQSE